MKTYLQKRNSGDLFDMFDDFFRPMFYDEHLDSMRTDIKETDKDYQLSIEMPGFKKDNISLELQNGYLTVSARRDSAHEDKDNNGKWLRRERYVGSCSRSFYVGEDMKDSDIHASYKDGTLCLELPKPQAQQQGESKHRIAIEG